MIRSVATPAGNARASQTRPAQLMRAAVKRYPGWVPLVVSHGRNVEIGTRIPLNRMLRPTSLDSPSAVMTPLLLQQTNDYTFWIDLYDDWSLAPEFSRSLRSFIRWQYRSLLKRKPLRALVTVNSLYMQDKFAALSPHLLPNGFDPESVPLPQTGISGQVERQLVLVGNFRRHRTDYAMIEAALQSSVFDSCLIFGADNKLRSLVNGLRDERIRIRGHTPWETIASEVSSSSVLLIANLVNDYTLSQDPLKFYQFAGMGARVCLPFELKAPWMPEEVVSVIAPGTSVAEALQFAFSDPRPDSRYIEQFRQKNSWDSRIEALGAMGVYFLE